MGCKFSAEGEEALSSNVNAAEGVYDNREETEGKRLSKIAILRVLEFCAVIKGLANVGPDVVDHRKVDDCGRCRANEVNIRPKGF